MEPPSHGVTAAGAAWTNPSCFVLGPHRSGTTIVCSALAASGAFVCLTAADIVAFHERSGGPGDDRRSALSELTRRGETRGIDAVPISEDLPEEYGFLVPGRRLTPETAPVVAAVYRELAGDAEDARYLLRNPWDFPNTAGILDLLPQARFVFVARDPVETIDSQLRAIRLLLAGPSEYHALLDLRYRRLLRRPLRFALYRFVAGRPRMVDLLSRSLGRDTARWLRDLDRLPAEHRIVTRYEDLIEDPAGELKRIYAFLELPGARIDPVAREIRPGERVLHQHVAARIPSIRARTRLFRERFGY